MIKRVKILGVHPRDNFYPFREQIIGRIVTLDIRDEEFIKGFKASNFNRKLFEEHHWNGVEFVAISVEDAE